ncbi:MAG: CGNR zinc finger domain-containing protein [Actinobacteria bacterium]|nr:MAG: CGNR zinc finger domain-containing protein [Actinomycetota bacterium]
MYVTSGHDTEIRLTLEAAIDFLNGVADGDIDARALLDDHGFLRAKEASTASISRVEKRMRSLLPDFLSLLGADAGDTTAWINIELERIEITPSLTIHDGAPLHIHWTPATAAFDDQVIADVLMALAQEVCDHGTTRFGICAATDCEHLFYDSTRNRSRRFCADPRCASRTHTADHRARQKNS